MLAEEISIKVGYGAEKVTFCFGVISLEDEDLYVQRYAAIEETDPQRREKEYRCAVDALAAWSKKTPTILKEDADGKKVEEPVAPGTPSEAVREYFKTMTNQSSRIVNATIISFRNRMVPDVDFL